MAKDNIEQKQHLIDLINMEKQTAVEWLVIQLWEEMNMQGDGKIFNDLLEQAKEMEKQQQGYSEEDLKHAFFSGCQSERQFKPRIKCWEEWFEQFKKK